MRIVQINGGVFGSTGRIMFGIADIARKRGYGVRCFSPVTSTNKNREPDSEYTKIGGYFSRRVNVLLEALTGLHGSFARIATAKLLKQIKAFSPDIIQLHTIHGGYINLPMLFRFLKKENIPTIWTLHDCWSFTGGCPHFEEVSCEKWKTGCYDCPIFKEYPKSVYDNTALMYRRKKKLFSDIENLRLVTPSAWLKDLVKQSYLKDYPVSVINNGIDLTRFSPTESGFREEHGLQNKIILLGVAFGWSERKGLDVFIKLAKVLPEEYQIVLVGTDDAFDAELPANVISIHRTQDVSELAQIYSAADLFVNPTREDSFPTVNIEALACGTPVLTYRTGGSPEIPDDSCGRVVEKDDFDALVKQIKSICHDKPFSGEACIRRASMFDEKKQLSHYVTLYEELCDERAAKNRA